MYPHFTDEKVRPPPAGRTVQGHPVKSHQSGFEPARALPYFLCHVARSWLPCFLPLQSFLSSLFLPSPLPTQCCRSHLSSISRKREYVCDKCLCVHVCAVFVYLCVYMHTFTNMQTCMQVLVCLCTCIYAYMYVHL